VQGLVEGRWSATGRSFALPPGFLIRPFRDGVGDPFAAQRLSGRRVGIGLVGQQPEPASAARPVPLPINVDHWETRSRRGGPCAPVPRLAYRDRAPHLTTHVSSQYLRDDSGAASEWAPPLMPPMWVYGDELKWRSDLTDAEGTALLVATGVACAVDDVMTGTGPLSRQHLPAMLFEPYNAPLRREIEAGVRRYTGLCVEF